MRTELYNALIKLRKKYNNDNKFLLDVDLEINCHKHSDYMLLNKCNCKTSNDLLDGDFECDIIIDLYESISDLSTISDSIIKYIEIKNEFLNNILRANIIDAFISIDHHTFYCCIRGR